MILSPDVMHHRSVSLAREHIRELQKRSVMIPTRGSKVYMDCVIISTLLSSSHHAVNGMADQIKHAKAR
jgi:hypothetical protein